MWTSRSNAHLYLSDSPLPAATLIAMTAAGAASAQPRRSAAAAGPTARWSPCPN